MFPANRAKVELGEGVIAHCKLPEQKTQEAAAGAQKRMFPRLSAMLAAEVEVGRRQRRPRPRRRAAGQIRSFKIVSLDPRQPKRSSWNWFSRNIIGYG